MSMQVQARLRVTSVEHQPEARIVRMAAVYSADPTSPNHSFSKATPWADLAMAITNPEVMGCFRQGDEIDVLMTPRREK